ncbi:hypothetical protein WDU94_003036 [Cyamophila willieti]
MLSLASMLGLPLLPLLVASSVLGLGLRSAGTLTCGEITCQLYEFCSSEVDHQCRKCSVICDSKARNYDENTCDQFCQDYIHDFVREYIKRGDIKVLEDQIDQLKSIVSISLLLGILLSILALLTGVFVWIRYRKYILPINSVGNDYNKEKEKYIEMLNRNNNALGNNNADPTISIITPPSTLPQVRNVLPSDENHHPTVQSPPRQNAQYTQNMDNHTDGRYNPQDAQFNKNGNRTYNDAQNGSYTAPNKQYYNNTPTQNVQNNNFTAQTTHYKDLPAHVAYPLNVSPDSSATSNDGIYFPSTHGRSSTTPHGRSSVHGRRSVSPPSTASTQLIGQMPRFPSEDATLELEHAAYDNLAMTPTPPRTTVTVNERY